MMRQRLAPKVPTALHRFTDGASGSDSKGRPYRKCPGVNASMPWSSESAATSGRLFKQDSIWQSTVVYSSNVSLASPRIRLKCFFTLLTADSHKPPKCGARSGIYIHCIIWCEQKSEISPFLCCSSRNAARSANSHSAPTKFEPWSLQMAWGLPRRAMNLLRHAMKEAEVRSETNSL